MISSCKINHIRDKDPGVCNNSEYDLMNNNGSKHGIPPNQIFESNDYQKTKLYTECETSKLEESPNFLKQGRSVKRAGKSSEKDKRTILPVQIRGNYDRRNPQTSLNRMKCRKESNSLIENKYQNHPMIINQMHEPQEINALTPKTCVRDIRELKTTSSCYPIEAKEDQYTEEINLPLFQIEKGNNYLKKKIAYEFNYKDDKSSNERPSPMYKAKYNLPDQKVYNDLTTEGSTVPKKPFQKKFNSSESGMFKNIEKYKKRRGIDEKISSQEKKFPHHIYKKDKLVSKAIKIKTVNRKYHKDFLDNKALDCGICNKNDEAKSLIPLSCTHSFHPECLRDLIVERISKKSVPVSCPICNKQLLEREIKILIHPNQYEKYITMILSKTLRSQELHCIYCYTPITNKKDSLSLKISCK